MSKTTARKNTQGTFEVRIGGEVRNYTRADVFIGPTDLGGAQLASFDTPYEDGIQHRVTVNVPYPSPAGKYTVLPGAYQSPGARYSENRPGRGGEWTTVHHASSGTITIKDVKESRQAMSGSFKFEVEVGTVLQTIEGEFDLYD